MKGTRKEKKQKRAIKTMKNTCTETSTAVRRMKTVATENKESVEHTQVDTAVRSSKSNSSIVSSLYLFSLTVIIFALAAIVGLVSYAYSYHFTEKSADRIGFKSVHIIEDTVHGDVNVQDPEDVKDIQSVAVDSDSKSDDKRSMQTEINKKSSVIHEGVLNLEHRDLFHSYRFNFEKAQKLRQEAMKKYSYNYSINGVDKRSNLSLQEFYDVYDGKWPVIITDVIPTWPAFKWSKETFVQKYGKSRVAMVAHNIMPQHMNGKREGFSVPLEIFLLNLNVSSKNSWTYLQDEVFLVQFPELREQVLDTIYSKEDFFKLFPRQIQPWDCFLLWGTAYSRSTLHIDPYNWTGTNAVISGHKKWKLFLPGQDEHLSVIPDSACGFPLQCQKYNSVYDTYNTTEEMKKKLRKLKFLEVDQLSGEMLFLPTGWFHQAFNVVPTLAVSGEIMNRNNYLAILEEIFNVGNLPRSVLPDDVEKMMPQELVEFVMSKMPSKILEEGERWTQTTIASLSNPSLMSQSNQ